MRAICTLIMALPHCYALSAPASSDRRTFVHIAGAQAVTLAGACAGAEAAPPLPLQTASSSSPVRVEEVGGGFDLLSPPSTALSTSDVFYPGSMANTQWKVQRVVTNVEGDLGQAAIAWKSLGGGDERAFTSKLTEVYNTKFISAPDTMQDASYHFEGKTVRSAILDLLDRN